MKHTDTKTTKSPNVIVVKKLRDYNSEPVFKKKAEEAKAYLKKSGLFEKLTRKK